MMKRIRQFFRAIFASVSDEDKTFAEKYLETELQNLFWGMSVPDQQHALHTAYTAVALSENATETMDLPLLVRCALLHDIGRKKGELGVFWKSFAVIFAAVCPRFARDCGNTAGGNVVARKMRVYFHHPEMGADSLFHLGFAREAEIVRKHHEAPAENDPPELRILRMADEMN